MWTTACRTKAAAASRSALVTPPWRCSSLVGKSFSSSSSSSSSSSLPKPKAFVPEDYENKYLVKTYNPNGVRGEEGLLFTHGNGQYLYDAKGRKFLDFYGGIAVSSLGHSDPDWYKSLVENAKNVCHTSNLFHTKAPLQLAQSLVDHSCFDKVFFANTGTEANEAAFKFARMHAARHTLHTSLEGKKTEFIAFKGGFHGRTAGSLSLTYKPYIRERFLPLVPGIHFADLNNLDQLKTLFNDRICGVFVEPVQGEGGIHPVGRSFMKELRRLCDAHHALLIVDEIQCGLGRTGKLFAHEWYEITPDIMTLAKPLAGGLPIGATLVTNTVASAVQVGSHGTTFGGNALVCAVANTVLHKIAQPNFLAQVQKRGKYLMHQLRKLQQKYPLKIAQLRAPPGESGLFVGVECKKPVAPLMQFALQHNILIISAGDKTIRLCPPLIVNEADIDQLIEMFDQAFAKDVV